MRRSFLLVLGAFILLVAVVVVLMYRAATPPRYVVTIDDREDVVTLPAPTTNRLVASATKSATQNSGTAMDAAKEAEREAILEAFQGAMDDNDEERILVESMKLMKHSDPAIRRDAVMGLRWIGAKGLVALSDMLYDKDPDVAREAAEAWLDEMREMNDNETKAEFLGNVYDVDSLDENTLNELLALFLDLPEHLAARQLFEMLKHSKKPEYQEEILVTLNFVIQPDESFEMDNLPQAMRDIEAWVQNNWNGVVEEDE